MAGYLTASFRNIRMAGQISRCFSDGLSSSVLKRSFINVTYCDLTIAS
jgi:hypothetical protein